MIFIGGPQRSRRFAAILPPPAPPRVWIRRGFKEPLFTLTVQDVYPNRVLISADRLEVGQVVSVTRTVAGSTVRTAVRGGDDVAVTSDALVLVDAEAPQGVLLTYRLTVDNVDYGSASLTLTLAGGRVALSDSISGNAAEVVILAWPEKRVERSSSVFPVGGRNIVVSGLSSGFTSTVDLFVETDASKNNVLDLLRNATSGILQLRSDQSATSDGADCYFAATSWNESRYSQDGTDERRIISVDVVETGPWGPGFSVPGFTLQDLADSYPNETLADLAADYTTLLSIALGDFS